MRIMKARLRYVMTILLIALIACLLEMSCGDLDTAYFRVGTDAIVAVVGWPSNSPPFLQAMLNSGQSY